MQYQRLLSGYRARKGLPADAPWMDASSLRRSTPGRPRPTRPCAASAGPLPLQIYNLNVLLDLEKVAIGGGISKQPILVETLNEVYEEYILRAIPSAKRRPAACPARRSCPAGS
mgnify:CR=1 FL=1